MAEHHIAVFFYSRSTPSYDPIIIVRDLYLAASVSYLVLVYIRCSLSVNVFLAIIS